MANINTAPLLHYNNKTSSLFFCSSPISSASKTPSFNTFVNINNINNSNNNSNSLVLKRPPLYSFSLSFSSSSSSSWCRWTTTRVSTAPVEYAPPAPDFNFHEEITRLKTLRTRLSNSRNIREKHSIIDNDSRVKRFFSFSEYGGVVARVLSSLNLDSSASFLVKCLVAAGQEHVICVTESDDNDGGGDDDMAVTVRSSVKSALYALVEMIEKLDVDNNIKKNGLGEQNGVVFSKEEIGDLKRLLKNLGEIEQFYDCIGGIIG